MRNDPAATNYRSMRIAHWNRVSEQFSGSRRLGAFYQRLLHRYYRFFVPPGLRVIELGCGHGDLLAALKPDMGVGVDFSPHMIAEAKRRHPALRFLEYDSHELRLDEPFDVVILSDLVNDLWDVQTVLERIRSLCHSRTRLIINFHSNMWRIPLSWVRALGLSIPILQQNWLTPLDVRNLLSLSGFEVLKHTPAILLPLPVPLLDPLFNRLLAPLWPFRIFTLCNFVVARPDSTPPRSSEPSVSLIIAARNEAGNIRRLFQELPQLGSMTELLFIEGHSTDNTVQAIEEAMREFPDRPSRLLRQKGKGKADAVRLGMEQATGDILIIYDADVTVPPEDLHRFYRSLVEGKGDFINGVRLVYPMEDQSMRFLNMVGNKFFSLSFTWLLGQPIKDTLCGTKALWKTDYERIAANRDYFGDFDPFGDFDLLFGAVKQNMKIVEIPIRYRSRTYGTTNISRWRHGLLLLRMTLVAARRVKFV